MKKYMKEFQDSNPERFNEDLFYLRSQEDVLQAVTSVLKSIEVLDEVEILDVKLETDESQFGPIKSSAKGVKQLYKPILPSRLNKITYSYRIYPSENVQLKPILSDNEESTQVERVRSENNPHYDYTGFFYMNKLVDDWFYVNEGARYYLIYQIVDNATYSTGNSISLKSLLMPITIQKRPEQGINVTAEGTGNTYNLPVYYLLLFAKNVNVLLYYLAKYSFNDILRMPESAPETLIEDRAARRCPQIIDRINEFFGTDIRFSDKIEDLLDPSREIFKTPGENGVYLSVEKEKLDNHDQNLYSILGCFFDLKVNVKTKKKTPYSYDNLITPTFWTDMLASYFTVNTDPLRKFEKIKTMLVSLDRLTDESTRNVLRLDPEDKKNTLTIIRYILRNYDYLNERDPNDFDEKRIRIIESLLFPLRDYISKQIYRVLNASTRSKTILERIFSNITPTFLLKTTVTSELLRYYNSTNEIDIFTVLRVTQTGPQSLSRTVSNTTRDVQPSQIGRLSLISASAGNPGLSSLMNFFCELEPGMYFAPQKNIKL